MDLFTCGSGKLIPTLPIIHRTFGVKASDEDADDPTMLWSHKLRGFREGFVPGYSFDLNPLDSDLGAEILSSHDCDIKEPLVSAETEFQTVDIWEVLDPEDRRVADYYKSLEDDGSYESLHPEFFAPDKVLLLDGRIQSTRYVWPVLLRLYLSIFLSNINFHVHMNVFRFLLGMGMLHITKVLFILQ